MNKKKKVDAHSNEDASSKKAKLTSSNKNKSKVVKSKAQSKGSPAKKRTNALVNKKSSKGNSTSKVPSKGANVPKSVPKRAKKLQKVKTSAVVKEIPVPPKSTNVNGEIPAKRSVGRPRIRPLEATMSKGKVKPEKLLNASSKLSSNVASNSGHGTDGRSVLKPKKTSGSSKKATSPPSTKKIATKSVKVTLKGITAKRSSVTGTSSEMKSTADSSISQTSSRKPKSGVASSQKKATKNESKPRAVSSTTCNLKSTEKAAKPKKALGRKSKAILIKTRGRREASLNAIAKVKVLCESDRDSSSGQCAPQPAPKPPPQLPSGRDDSSERKQQKTKQSTKPDSKSTNRKQKKKAKRTNVTTSKSSKSVTKSQSSSGAKKEGIKGQQAKKADTKAKNGKLTKVLKSATKNQKNKKKVKRKRSIVDRTVEIIDTRRCKRMASLNATAMMAATYLPEARFVRSLDLAPPPALSPELTQPQCLDTSSNVAETIDQVVRQWSTVQQHTIEISPGTSVTGNAGQRKTTVTTTVKHVKMRGSGGTVVETISTEVEQRNVRPEPAAARKTHKRKSQTKPSSKSAESRPPQMAPAVPSSTFTSTSRPANPYLNPDSIESLALLSPQAPSTFATSSSVSVQNYQTNSISTAAASGVQQTSKEKHSRKRTKKPATRPTDSEEATNSSSITYQVKRIETRVESTVNEPTSGNNSVLANRVILSGNAPASSVVNFNGTPLNGFFPRPQQSQPLPYNLYNQAAPFSLMQSGSALAPHGVSNLESRNSFEQSPSVASALNCINLSPFHAPLLQYQPFAGTFSSLPPSGFASPISVPFLQFSNHMQPFSSYPYDLMNQRVNPLAVSSLLGLSYLAPNFNGGLYPPPSPIINIVPSPPSVIHRPVAYHAQAGHVSAAPSASLSGLVNSSVMGSSSVYSNSTIPMPTSNLFQCSSIRPSSMGNVPPHFNLPAAPSSQSLPAFLPNASVSSSSITIPTAPLVTIAPSSSLLQPDAPVSTVREKESTSPPFASNGSSSSQSEASQDCLVVDNQKDPNWTNANCHIHRLTTITNSIVSVPEEDWASLGNKADQADQIGHKLSRTKRVLEVKSPQVQVNNGVNGSPINGKSNGTKSLCNSKASRALVPILKVPPNGIVKRSSPNGGLEGDRKRPKLAKSLPLIGSPAKANLSGKLNCNRISVQSNGSPNGASKSKSSSEKGSKPPTASATLPVNGSPTSDAQLLKKNRRPIVHGWSWEGIPEERFVYVNVSAPPLPLPSPLTASLCPFII